MVILYLSMAKSQKDGKHQVREVLEDSTQLRIKIR
jgi:hypothetical protein